MTDETGEVPGNRTQSRPILSSKDDLSAMRARDSASAETWFKGPASFTAQAARDRRELLALVQELSRIGSVSLLRDARQSIRLAADANCVCVDGGQQCKYCKPHRALLERIDEALASGVETTQHPPVGAIRDAQLYRALERLHYAVKNLAEAHAFDLTGSVKSDHESSLWLDLNDAQANAAQKIKHFAGPDVKAGEHS